jgi:hypothetical protein
MSEWVTSWGKSLACLIDMCEECEHPTQCDCDCHPDDPPDGYPSYDQNYPEGW